MFKVLLGKILYRLGHKKNLLIGAYFHFIYKKNLKGLGTCVRFNGISTISGLDKIVIGNNVHIGNNAHIKGHGGLVIGDNTHISRNLVLYTVNHDYHGSRLPYDSNELGREVIIEKNVWIGMNVVILPGTHIQEGAIIGAGAVVAGTVPKLGIYGATTGSILKYRDEEHYTRLEHQKQYGGINGNEISQECIDKTK